MNKIMRALRQSGYTLLEILIVLACIAILVAIILWFK